MAFPRTTDEAYAYINSVAAPTVHDFKVMVMLEAAGQALYEGLAADATNEDVRQLLSNNAIEELGHAERLIEVIRRVSGETFAAPARADNPYVPAPGSVPLSRGFLGGVVTGELQGEALYEAWAALQPDAEVARLLRLNGREERTHSERAQQALDLLPA
jgi:rubrerythrin